MASVATVRVSGSVLSVPSPRKYTYPQGSEKAGQSLVFESANILVADTNVTVVDLPRRDETGILEHLEVRELVKGDVVDLLCEVSIYRQDVQTRVIGVWPADDVAGYLSAGS